MVLVPSSERHRGLELRTRLVLCCRRFSKSNSATQEKVGGFLDPQHFSSELLSPEWHHRIWKFRNNGFFLESWLVWQKGCVLPSAPAWYHPPGSASLAAPARCLDLIWDLAVLCRDRLSTQSQKCVCFFCPWIIISKQLLDSYSTVSLAIPIWCKRRMKPRATPVHLPKEAGLWLELRMQTLD